MYVTEYLCFSKSTKVAVRGVLMYREKRDLSEKRKRKVLAIYVIHRMFPKRSQRKNIWKRIWSGGETQHLLYIDISEYFVDKNRVRIVGTDISVYGFQIRSFRRYLKNDQKREFDRFYYEK